MEMNSSINSSELLTDEEDWAKDSSGTSQLDIIIIIFTSLILGMMILTTIIGKHTLYIIWNNTNIMCLNKCQQNYGNYLELLATLQKHCQRSQFVVPRGNSPLHTIYYYYLHHFAMCTTPSTSTSFNLQIFQQLNNLYFW